VFDEVHSPHCPLAAQLSLPSVSSYVMRNDFFSSLSFPFYSLSFSLLQICEVESFLYWFQVFADVRHYSI
jgi:hypothetical protein